MTRMTPVDNDWAAEELAEIAKIVADADRRLDQLAMRNPAAHRLLQDIDTYSIAARLREAAKMQTEAA